MPAKSEHDTNQAVCFGALVSLPNPETEKRLSSAFIEVQSRKKGPGSTCIVNVSCFMLSPRMPVLPLQAELGVLTKSEVAFVTGL